MCEKIDTYFIVLISWEKIEGKQVSEVHTCGFWEGNSYERKYSAPCRSMLLPSPILRYTHDKKTGTSCSPPATPKCVNVIHRQQGQRLLHL